MRQTKILAYCWPGKDNGAAFDYAKTIDYLAVVGFTLNQAGEVCVPGGFTQLLPVRERGD